MANTQDQYEFYFYLNRENPLSAVFIGIIGILYSIQMKPINPIKMKWNIFSDLSTILFK